MNLLRFTLSLVASLGLLVSTGAQTLGYKEYRKLGERFAAQGQYLEAAEQFAGAYKAKPGKSELAFQAAEYFYLVKDYKRAARHFKAVARDFKEYPLAGLKYARSLKQTGDYAAATQAYLDYLSYYRGDDRDIIKEIVELEVRGAQMAQQEAGFPTGNYVVDQLNAGLNTSANEIAPMPLAATALYYLSDKTGKTRMMRSDLSGSLWGEGKFAEQFPIVPGKNVGSGALSPEGDRFYFSICDGNAFMGQPAAKCELYVIVRRDDAWTSPQALPSYINTEGNTTSHPFAYKEGDKEVLLFSSDRLDGYGGMDLYRAERYLGSDATDFSFPQNLGPVVNSVADEVTPYYEPGSQRLYFASNGYLNYGGFDIFRTLGGKTGWNEPENMKSPVNSAADDYYFRSTEGSTVGYFASNRAFGTDKQRTSNEDIFSVRPGVPLVPVSLAVVDSVSGRALGEVALAVYVKAAGSNRRLIASELSEDGYFALQLPMGSTIEIDAQRLDYRRRVVEAQIPKNSREGYQLPRLKLARIELPLTDVQRIEGERTEPPVAIIPSSVGTPASKRETVTTAPRPEPAPVAKPPKREPVVTSATTTTSKPPVTVVEKPTVTTRPAPSAAPATTTRRVLTRPVLTAGKTYRIQIEARRGFDADHERYDKLRGIGPITSDFIAEKNLHRVMVGSFATLTEARAMLPSVKASGYGDAFVARFENGVYKGLARG